MGQGLSGEEWRHLRRQARHAASQTSEGETVPESTEPFVVAELAQLEQRLEQLDQGWAIHRKPLDSRVPLIGRLVSWFAARLVPFLLQHQVAFNAETTRTLRDLYNAQQLLVRELVERTDDLFCRLEETLLALEARTRDLEEEVERLRQDR